MMRLLLFALLLPGTYCSAQILIQPNPHATSYKFYAGQPPRAVISPLTNEEQTKLQQVYTAALQGSSTLDAEADTLSASMTHYQTVLKAAMVKADPAVGPALQKMSGSPLTQAESNEIRQAQSRAMQADPNLQSQWDDLTKKMTQHQQNVDAAMIKLDPTVASILAKLSP
ncbi:MAG: hypothetical protein WCD79_13215 [Chthoniobacteraceae bacterium]